MGKSDIEIAKLAFNTVIEGRQFILKVTKGGEEVPLSVVVEDIMNGIRNSDPEILHLIKSAGREITSQERHVPNKESPTICPTEEVDLDGLRLYVTTRDIELRETIKTELGSALELACIDVLYGTGFKLLFIDGAKLFSLKHWKMAFQMPFGKLSSEDKKSLVREVSPQNVIDRVRKKLRKQHTDSEYAIDEKRKIYTLLNNDIKETFSVLSKQIDIPEYLKKRQ